MSSTLINKCELSTSKNLLPNDELKSEVERIKKEEVKGSENVLFM